MSLPADLFLFDTRANQPAATDVVAGTLYVVSDEDNAWERSNGSTWDDVTPAGASGATQTTGTWTPGIAFGGAAVGVTYSLQLGRYVRTGDLVHATGHFILTSKGSSTGAVTITGLPFTTKNTTNYGQAGSVGIPFGTTVAPTLFADPNVTVMRVWNPSANAALSDASVSGAGEWVVSLTYEV